MNSERFNTLKTETIKSPDGGEASFCPERGGIITSIKLHNKKILYLDKDTLQDKEASVRGGIPILFPNAGPIENQEFPGLKQHGFARDSNKWKAKKRIDSFEEILVSGEENIKSYPYDFILSMEGKFKNNGSFEIKQKVQNLEKNKELPISMGLHPYFKVPKEEKKNIKFNFEGGKFIEEKIENWANGKYICIDNPLINNPFEAMEIIIPKLGTLIIKPSTEYQKIWIWSMPDKDFICIEPVMRDKNGLVKDPEMVRPGESLTGSMNINLKI